MKPLAIRPLSFSSVSLESPRLVRGAHPASATASVTIASGSNATRSTIPVTMATGTRTACSTPGRRRLSFLRGRGRRRGSTLELERSRLRPMVTPTSIVKRRSELSASAVVAPRRSRPDFVEPERPDALCGYDFFTHFPTLIDRDRRLVTLFPSASRVAHLHCVQVDLTPHVPLATIRNQRHVGESRRARLRHGRWRRALGRGALQAPPAARRGCQLRDDAGCDARRICMWRGRVGAIRTRIAVESACRSAPNPNVLTATTASSRRILRTLHAMAVDYPHHHVCFDVGGYAAVAPIAPAPAPSGAARRMVAFQLLPAAGIASRFRAISIPSQTGSKHDIDSFVPAHFHVEGAQRTRVLVVRRRIEHGAVPEHVVDQDEAARPNQLERRFVISSDVRFIRVDKCHVERLDASARAADASVSSAGAMRRSIFSGNAGSLPR